MAGGKRKGTPKTGGRVKGEPNKVTAKAKEIIMNAIDNQSVAFDQTMTILQRDEPKEWAKIMVKLMDFVLPKKLDITSKDGALNIPVSKWANENDNTEPEV
jgi:hypothetical protein